ncbi:thioredoxin domain-containing protein [bacterium]|nr:thioredoxin domain-containing protein [bacterium]NUN47102.1 conjugal transfer protein TraF [bacterium]
MISLVLTSCAEKKEFQNAAFLSTSAFADSIKKSPDALLIDVRTRKEYLSGHIPGAENINWANMGLFEYRADRWDPEKPILLYCSVGGRSTGARRGLIKKGFKRVYELDGGFISWRAAGYPKTTTSEHDGMSRDSFDSLTRSKKPVLIDFYTLNCSPCRQMEPIIHEIADMNSFDVVTINIDEHPLIADTLHIHTVPTFHIYKNNRLTWSHIGRVSKEKLLEELRP